MGQGAVVGEEQEPLGVLIQAAHRRKAPAPQLRGQQVQHGFLPAVPGGGENAGRLVEHQIGKAAVRQGFAVHPNVCGGGVYFHICGGGRLTIHLHTALAHQVLYLPPGPAARGGEEFIQSFHVFSPVCISRAQRA